jgi:hypothetical protein
MSSAVTLESNCVNPHQVLLDTKFDCFQHEDTLVPLFLGLHPSSPRTHPLTTGFSDGSYLSLLFSVLFCWERTRKFLWRVSIWRVVFVSVLFVLMFPFVRAGSTSLHYQMVSPYVGDPNKLEILMLEQMMMMSFNCSCRNKTGAQAPWTRPRPGHRSCRTCRPAAPCTPPRAPRSRPAAAVC